MSNTNTGGPAFPVPDIDGSKVCEGMTIRDYFAAKAMEALVSNRPPIAASIEAYKYADAMLKVREAS
jgi:hypothetical protein